MLNAILNSKSGRLGRDAERSVSWRDLFKGSEDLVTATIFERLSYLPAETAWNILAAAAGGQLHSYRMAELTTMEYWPMWDVEGRSRGVEPDVFLELKLGDPALKVQVIVEAKHGGSQSADQLKAELKAWAQAIESDQIEVPDLLVILAIGGLRSTSKKHQLELDFDAVTQDFNSLPETTLLPLDWDDLARAFALLAPKTQHEQRIVDDMREALGLYGYYHVVEPRHLELLLDHRPVNRSLTALLMTLNNECWKNPK